jgi:glycosyltransferase involved in cell wall biosynthesis
VRALSEREALDGVVSVVPSRLIGTPECREWVVRFAAEHGVRAEVVGKPADLGVTILREVSDRVVRFRLRSLLSARSARLVHARGIRAGYLAAGIGGLPFLLDVRGDSVAEARLDAALNPSARANRLIAWSERETAVSLRTASGFAVVSDAMAEWLAESVNVAGRPVEVLPCPIHVGTFSLRECFAPAEELIVAYVGGLQSYQSPALVARTIAALSRVTPVPLRAWVVTPSEHDHMRALLESLGVRGTVEALSHQQIEERLCEADVGIVPRDSDPVSRVSCPTKIGEYLSAGVPVLAGTGVGHWASRIAAQGAGGSLGEGESLDAGIPRLLTAICQDRAGFATRCRAVAERDWSWASAAPKLLGLYETTMWSANR